jgi:tetratricopeptide (TPR) repeat protein
MNSFAHNAKLPMDSSGGIRSACILLLIAASFLLSQPRSLAQTTTVPTKDRQATSLLQQGLVLASQGQLARAQLVLEKAEQLAPRNVKILTTLGKVKARIGENAAATAIFRRIVVLRPNSARAYLDLAISLADQGRLQAALEQVDRALTLAPHSGMVHLNRARLLADMNQLGAAKKEFAQAATLSPSNPDIYFYWALLEQKTGDYAHESSLLRTLFSLQPHNVKACILLARSLDYQSKRTEALRYWHKAFVLNPDSKEAVYNLWQADKKSDPAEAARMREHFLQLSQRSNTVSQAEALGNRAYVAMQHHQWPVAIQALQRANALCGQCTVSPTIYKDLGLAYCHAGKLIKCKQYLRIALKLNPDDPEILKALSIADHQ